MAFRDKVLDRTPRSGNHTKGEDAAGNFPHFSGHMGYSAGMSEPNDLIYGVHPVAEALKNPKRKIYSLKASKNAADRLDRKSTRLNSSHT